MKKLFDFTSKIFLLLLVLLVCLSLFGNSFAQTKDTPMPKWLQEHMNFITAGTGIWITDNSRFKNENEPFDEYGTEWKWGIGKKSITGRLFGLKDQKEAGDLWEFRLFWHPQERKAILQQFGGNGIVGIGEMRNIESTGVRWIELE